MDFGFDATTEDYRKRLLAFMAAHVYPAEAGWHSDGWAPPAALAGLQAAARDAGRSHWVVQICAARPAPRMTTSTPGSMVSMTTWLRPCG